MIEAAELRDAVDHAFPPDRLAPDRVESWRRLVDLGSLAAPVDERHGGLGLGASGIAALSYACGGHLSRTPLVTALAVARALAPFPAWHDRVQAGEIVAASLGGDRVSRSGTLHGHLTGVLDADLAVQLLVFGDGIATLVPCETAAVRATATTTWDETRLLGEVVIDGLPLDQALVLAEGDDADRMADHYARDTLFALAGDSLGGAAAALRHTIEYLKLRRQFDRPLAMFQALKHRCADLATAVAAAEALLWALAADDGAPLTAVAALKAHACATYAMVTEEAIQLHGGIGLTEEHMIHLFMKRAALNAALGADHDAAMAGRGRALFADAAAEGEAD